MNENKEFKPYIPAEKVTAEMTVTSVIMGVILAIVFGAANAYLGLRVGMTVSASIPAAVISMGVIRVIMKKNSILESNLVQTIGSAGESLAAGAIFTMPALFLWAEEGLCDKPSLVEITLIALCGGVLGVLFMVPLRNALIVKEHATLLYPEGTACADVLLAGEEGGANASTVFSGMGLAAVFKFVVDGLKVIPADVSAAFTSLKGEIGMEVYPALLGVGYIVGPRVASFMFVGSIVGWLVIIPMICLFGPDTWLYPADPGVTISQLYAAGGAAAIWSKYVKYIGAGAIATGGIISLIKSMPLIISTFRDSMKSMKGGSVKGTARTDRDLPMNFILIGIVAMVVIIWAVPAIPVNPLGALLIVIFGFFFATAAYQLDNAIKCVPGNLSNFFGLWLPNLIFDIAALAVLVYTAKELRPSYTAWFIAYYVIAIGATWLLSAPRYMISLLPFFLSVSQLAKTPRDTVLTAVCVPLWLLYEIAFVLRWQVW